MKKGLQVGDIVTLKSGGPNMTVWEIELKDGYGQPIYCAWFSDDHSELAKAHFPRDALEVVDPGEIHTDERA